MKSQRGIIVKNIRLDNDREFASGSFKNYYKSRGIRIQYTCSYTPSKMASPKGWIGLWWIELKLSSLRQSYQRPYGEKQLDVHLTN